jgi:hypothetical protein
MVNNTNTKNREITEYRTSTSVWIAPRHLRLFKLLSMKMLVLVILCLPILVKAQIITTVAGGAVGHGGYWGEGGPADSAEIDYFAGMYVDVLGNIYISDGNYDRILEVVDTSGIITTIAGTGTGGFNGDSIPATSAKIRDPARITSDKHGNLYFYDSQNNRVRKINRESGLISTYVGNGTFGHAGDGGPAKDAEIDDGSFSFDMSGNFYIGSFYKIRRIDTAGNINTYVGTGTAGSTLDSVPVTSTHIPPISAITLDTHGNIYFIDSTGSVRKISLTSGIITRIAGTGDNIMTPYSGDGIAATACHIGPYFGLQVDDTGNVFICDYTNSRIEKVDTSGIIRTIAGTGVAGFSGDGGEATNAELSHPENVVLDVCGNIYIADFNNKRLRKVTMHTRDTAFISLSAPEIFAGGDSSLVNASLVNTGSNYKIVWYKNGLPFDTTTTTSLTYAHTTKGNDTITATVIPQYLLCTDSSSSNAVVVKGKNVGLANMPCNERVAVYPNPAHTTLTIDLPDKTGDADVSLCTPLGVQALRQVAAGKHNVLSLATLPPGVYFVRVNGVYMSTIVKE